MRDCTPFVMLWCVWRLEHRVPVLNMVFFSLTVFTEWTSLTFRILFYLMCIYCTTWQADDSFLISSPADMHCWCIIFISRVWPWTPSATEDGLELLIPCLCCLRLGCALLHLVCAVHRIRALYLQMSTQHTEPHPQPSVLCVYICVLVFCVV